MVLVVAVVGAAAVAEVGVAVAAAVVGVLRPGGTAAGAAVVGAGGAGADSGTPGRSPGSGKEVALQGSPCSLLHRHHRCCRLLHSPAHRPLLLPRERDRRGGMIIT